MELSNDQKAKLVEQLEMTVGKKPLIYFKFCASEDRARDIEYSHVW